MMPYKTKKELIEVIGSNGLKELHRQYGFDWEEPVDIIQMNGPTTINKLLNLLPYQPTNDSHKVVILIKTARGWCKEYRVVSVDPFTKTFDIELPRRHTKSGSNLDNYWRKSDFNDDRKEETAEAWLIVQQKRLLKPEKVHNYERPAEINTRYNVKETNLYNTGEISSLYCYDERGEEFKLMTRNPYRWNQQKNNPFAIDKSGYAVSVNREELNHRAAILRQERQKAEYDATDNGGKIAELEEKLEERKAEIMKQLQNARTPEDFKNVSDALDNWKGYAGMLADFNRFKERTEQKLYRSIADSERAYNNILEGLRA